MPSEQQQKGVHITPCTPDAHRGCLVQEMQVFIANMILLSGITTTEAGE